MMIPHVPCRFAVLHGHRCGRPWVHIEAHCINSYKTRNNQATGVVWALVHVAPGISDFWSLPTHWPMGLIGMVHQ